MKRFMVFEFPDLDYEESAPFGWNGFKEDFDTFEECEAFCQARCSNAVCFHIVDTQYKELTEIDWKKIEEWKKIERIVQTEKRLGRKLEPKEYEYLFTKDGDLNELNLKLIQAREKLGRGLTEQEYDIFILGKEYGTADR